MSTLIEDLQALLAPLAAGGAHYAIAETPATQPYIVWQRIDSVPNVALSGPSALQNTRVQIDIYATTVQAAVAIEVALEAAFAASSMQNVPVLSQEFFENDTRLYRISKDYSVWASN